MHCPLGNPPHPAAPPSPHMHVYLLRAAQLVVRLHMHGCRPRHAQSISRQTHTREACHARKHTNRVPNASTEAHACNTCSHRVYGARSDMSTPRTPHRLPLAPAAPPPSSSNPVPCGRNIPDCSCRMKHTGRCKYDACKCANMIRRVDATRTPHTRTRESEHAHTHHTDLCRDLVVPRPEYVCRVDHAAPLHDLGTPIHARTYAPTPPREMKNPHTRSRDAEVTHSGLTSARRRDKVDARHTAPKNHEPENTV